MRSTPARGRPSTAQQRVRRVVVAAVPNDAPAAAPPTRRSVLLATLATATLPTPPALAAPDPASLPGRVSTAVAAFLRSRQRADGGLRLLTPVKLTRGRLVAAADALLEAGSGTLARDGLPFPAAYRAPLSQVRAASLKCFSADALDGGIALPASLTAPGAANTCVLTAVARNVTAGLPPSERVLARATLDEAEAVQRSLALLDDLLDRATEGDRRAAAGVQEAMEAALERSGQFLGLVERALFEEFGQEGAAK